VSRLSRRIARPTSPLMPAIRRRIHPREKGSTRWTADEPWEDGQARKPWARRRSRPLPSKRPCPNQRPGPCPVLDRQATGQTGGSRHLVHGGATLKIGQFGHDQDERPRRGCRSTGSVRRGFKESRHSRRSGRAGNFRSRKARHCNASSSNDCRVG
jgi:hypothetical protein